MVVEIAAGNIWKEMFYTVYLKHLKKSILTTHNREKEIHMNIHFFDEAWKESFLSHLCTTMEVKLIHMRRGGRGLCLSVLNQYVINRARA